MNVLVNSEVSDILRNAATITVQKRVYVFMCRLKGIPNKIFCLQDFSLVEKLDVEMD